LGACHLQLALAAVRGPDRHATAPGARGDPSDDVEDPDSFRVVRGSTGNSDLSDRDFCADLVEFTS